MSLLVVHFGLTKYYPVPGTVVLPVWYTQTRQHASKLLRATKHSRDEETRRKQGREKDERSRRPSEIDLRPVRHRGGGRDDLCGVLADARRAEDHAAADDRDRAGTRRDNDAAGAVAGPSRAADPRHAHADQGQRSSGRGALD